jgi:hypothetical protein
VYSYVYTYSIFLGTANHLNEAHGGYENITVAKEIGPPDIELLRFLHDNITPGRT